MKSIYIITCLMSMYVLTFGQQLSINGIISNIDGSPADSIYLTLVLVDGDIPSVSTYSDDQGEYELVLPLEQGPEEGCFVVSMFDCESNIQLQSDCFTTDNMDFTMDFTYCQGDSDGCYGYINVDQSNDEGMILTAVMESEIPPFMYQWSNGDTTQTIVITQNIYDEYCVTITDDAGCEASSCFSLDNPPECEVWIVDQWYGDTLVVLSAEVYAQSDVEGYEWSTGSTEDTIEVMESGEYCVTAFFADGCSADYCLCIELDSNECGVDITEGESEGTLFAEVYGNSPFSYTWSTGEESSEIQVSETGEYCVTIVDNSGCTSEDCYYYEQYCDEIIQETTDQGILLYVASDVWESYSWTLPDGTGSDQSSIIASVSGEYCVNLSNVEMECEVCASVEIDCQEEIVAVDQTDTSIVLGVFPYPDQWTFSYEWSTGDTTQTIEIFDNGIYCVDVYSDGGGCSFSSCYEVVGDFGCDGEIVVLNNSGQSATLQVIPYADGEYTYYWNTGDTTQEIVATETGWYEVEISSVNTDCLGYAYYYLDLGEEDCDISIDVMYGDDMSALLSVVTPIDAVDVQWSTGEDTQSITVNTTGWYCVEVSSSNGCYAEKCTYVSFDGCEGEIFEIDADTFFILTYLPLGGQGIEADFSYMWNTGDTTQSILVSTSGEYCVTVTSGENCEVGTCIDILLGAVPLSALSGIVTGNVESVLEGYVDIFSVTDGKVDYHSSQELDNNTFDLSGLENGSYIFHAFVSDQSYVPTYFGTTMFWDKSMTIEVNDNYNYPSPVKIPMINANAVSGDGSIAGMVVNEGFVTKDGPSNEHPVQDASILIFLQEQIVGHTLTDENGDFSFDGLPYGTYTLVWDRPGKEQLYIVVVLSPDNPDVSLEGLSSSVAESTGQTSLSILGNPVSDVLSIKINGQEGKKAIVKVVDENMRVVYQKDFTTCNDIHHFDISYLNDGVFFVVVSIDGKASVSKIVKF